ncbi:ABC-2 type transport system permease protein [Labedella gwakjiensis]|uniref:Transport permease protein n=1 Tax=Labedella gwakjiensis TaxID=390269 RepID=A0A2P8GUQ8_9MICO|nr:ABC transporter permease [Labedella gwakjiensis]PSL37702.1 ABC-2 type transport system permease protein [Labedella gwakjiensis]RUQ87705.1 ABC transporter permease [Labedella gwakjiensis]
MTLDATRTDDGAAPDPGSKILSALASSERPSPPGPLSTSLTFGWRALLKIKHVPEQLFDVTVFPVMFTLLFTFLFGGALAGSTVDYIQFLLPGIMVQGVIMITMYTGTTLRTDLEKGVFDRFRSLPIWRPSALVGMLLGDAVRFTISSIVTSLLGLLLGWRPEGGFPGVATGVLLILLFSFSLGWVWTFLSLVLRTSGAVMGVSMLVITPLTFGSNIFVDPSTMPGWLQAFVEVNPVSHLVTSVRALMNGVDPGASLPLTLVWCAVLVAVFGSLTMWRYRDAR